MKLNKKLSDAFNVLYQDMVNKHVEPDMNSPKYVDAKKYVEQDFPMLNQRILEYLSVYMVVHSTGKIEFYPSKGTTVDLLCTYADRVRLIRYDEKGDILKEETSKNAPLQQGE